MEITGQLEIWPAAMTRLQSEKGKNASNIIKKLKSAADKARFPDMRIKVSSHRGQLGVLLGILGVYDFMNS